MCPETHFCGSATIFQASARARFGPEQVSQAISAIPVPAFTKLYIMKNGYKITFQFCEALHAQVMLNSADSVVTRIFRDARNCIFKAIVKKTDAA